MTAPLTAEDALAILTQHVEPGRAEGARGYHKVDRPYLGVTNPTLNELTMAWRRSLTVDQRLTLAAALWDTNIFEARIGAAKLLTQARIKPDDQGAWDLLASWRHDFDSWAIADHVCMAGQKRLVAKPARIDEVETWTKSEHMWDRRAALVITLPWTKQNHPKPDELVIRDRILGWAASYVDDHDWFIQKAIGWWVRDLSKHDRERAIQFIDTYGERMKPFARREARRHLED